MSSGWFSVNWLWCTSFRWSMNYFASFDWNNQCSLFEKLGAAYTSSLCYLSLKFFLITLILGLLDMSVHVVYAYVPVCVHLSMEHPPQLFPTHVFRDRVSHWAWGEGSLNWQLVCRRVPGLRLSQPLQQWDYRSRLCLGGCARDLNSGLGACVAIILLSCLLQFYLPSLEVS